MSTGMRLAEVFHLVKRTLQFARRHFSIIVILGRVAALGRVAQLGGFGPISKLANTLL